LARVVRLVAAVSAAQAAGMSPLPLPPRPENLRVFFAGVAVKEACCAGVRRARRWRETAAEWVRPLLGRADWRRGWPEGEAPVARWVIDFPPGADERALAQAGEAGRVFQRAGARIARCGPAAELRIALAKCDRYLAAPAGGGRARWRWVPAAALPGRGLVVAVRDDEFLAGVLASRWLEVWLRGTGRRLGVAALQRFPLPWAPDAPRGALTREQEERRAVVVQAWRATGGGVPDLATDACAAQDLAVAVAAVYGWPAGIEEADALRLLLARA
jgi:hypothetical protein